MKKYCNNESDGECEYYVSSVREEDSCVRAEILSESGDVTRLRLTPKLWEKMNLERGDVVSGEKYTELCGLSERCEAVTRALFILSGSMCSRRELTTKLTSRGFSAEAAQYAVTLAQRRGYLDEAAQAESIAERQVMHCHRGYSRVVRELVAKGYPSEVARAAAERIPPSAYEEALDIMLAKKCRAGVPSEVREREKLVAAMCRQGFSAARVRRRLADAQSHFDEADS